MGEDYHQDQTCAQIQICADFGRKNKTTKNRKKHFDFTFVMSDLNMPFFFFK